MRLPAGALAVHRASRVSPRRATHFLLLRQEKSKQREGDAMVWVPCAALLGPARRVEEVKPKLEYRGPSGALEAQSASRAGLPTDRHVCTRAQHTRPHEVPSFAQRGERGVRGVSGESDLLQQADSGRSVTPTMKRSTKTCPTRITLALNEFNLVPIRISHKSNHGAAALDRSGFARHVAAG